MNAWCVRLSVTEWWLMGIGMSCAIQVKWWVWCDSNKIKFYHSKLENVISNSVHQVISLPVLYHDKKNLIRIRQVGLDYLLLRISSTGQPILAKNKLNLLLRVNSYMTAFLTSLWILDTIFQKNIRCRNNAFVPFPGKWLHKFNYY